jgi:hypothetical protein
VNLERFLLQKMICPILNPAGNGCLCRAAVWWIILASTILGWVVRRGKNDTIGEMARLSYPFVVSKNSS